MNFGEPTGSILHSEVLVLSHTLEPQDFGKGWIKLLKVYQDTLIYGQMEEGANSLPIWLRKKFSIRNDLVHDDIDQFCEVGPSIIP